MSLPARIASVERKSSETNIRVELNLDGSGRHQIRTPLPFLTHMLEQIPRHGLLDLTVEAEGDVEIVLTTTTSTGYRIAQDLHAATVDKVGIFPTDLWPCSALAWQRIRPDAAILVEGELWPEHLAQARARGQHDDAAGTQDPEQNLECAHVGGPRSAPEAIWR